MAAVVDKSNKGENVSMWLINYIKNHGGPYEIPQECKDSWDLMKIFIADSVFDKKTKEVKELRLHAITTGEALIEKANLCDRLTKTNDTIKYTTIISKSVCAPEWLT
ncbi:hypothetical protein XELAEV_18027089mg [Xenopus laevis]|uniref:Uncharacterized protein n=1 Tax=Xenopus laevis TaxID=8355 RepID=A0A974CWU3_XENLA|nr:hypothetical protein XELAEV_18027089mg [Xenopus laevis]